jgi:hypothetical protein
VKYGYARVSTDGQSVDAQVNRAAGDGLADRARMGGHLASMSRHPDVVPWKRTLTEQTKQLATLAQDWKESRRGAVLAMAASAMLSAALAKPQEMQAPLNDTKSTEVNR